jgi:potassium-transporting ATPase KdpC subunit
MKANIKQATVLTMCCIVFFCGVYTSVVWGVAQFSTNHGEGEIIRYNTSNGVIRYGFTNVGQSFTSDKYFRSRPSAVNYNAAGSGGSNKGPSDPGYLKQVNAAIDTFLLHNPGVKRSEVPAELVTASGSGLDPDISPEGAKIQVKRIAAARNLPEHQVARLVEQHIQKPLLGLFGPSVVNVLKLNIDLDKLK